MKFVAAILLVFAPLVAAAQSPQGPNPSDMQNFMELMQEMQTCIGNVDPAELEAFEKRSEEVDTEIDRLCTQGKRDEAQKKAIAYSRELSKHQAVKQIKKCSEKVASMMPEGEKSSMDDFDFASRHVCDEEQEQ